MTGHLILAAMVAAVFLLPMAVMAHHTATAPAEEPHNAADCRHCAPLHHPSQKAALAALATFPGQRGGDGS